MTPEEARKQLVEDLKDLPILLQSSDLVKMGLYASVDAAYLARVRGCSPAFMKLKGKILYSKSAVIDFLLKRIKDNE